MEPENEATCVKTEPQELSIKIDHVVTVKEELCEDSTSASTSQATAWDTTHEVNNTEVCVAEPGIYVKECLHVDSTIPSTNQAIAWANPYANEIKSEAEAVCVIKDEPLCKDSISATFQAFTGSNLYANEFMDTDYVCMTEVHVKEEPYEGTNLCASDAAVSSNLYVKHEVKEELVRSPEFIHYPHATLTETPMKPEQNTRQRSSATRPERLLVDTNEPLQPGDTDRPSNDCQYGNGFTYKSLKKHQHSHSISEGTEGSSAKKDVIPDLCDSTSKVEHTCQNYMCPDCDYTTVDKKSFKTHLKSHTKKILVYCNHCSYSSHNKMYLKVHLMRHDGKRRFKCSYCDLLFYRKSDVRKHEFTHRTERPHKCSSCDYQCNRKNELQIHMRTHTGEKPFRCNKCDYKSTRKFSLQRHQLIHGSETFQCSLCSFKTLHKPNLRVHERKHTGEMPYECSHCDFKCRYIYTLRAHLKKSSKCSQLQESEIKFAKHQKNHSGKQNLKAEAL